MRDEKENRTEGRGVIWRYASRWHRIHKEPEYRVSPSSWGRTGSRAWQYGLRDNASSPKRTSRIFRYNTTQCVRNTDEQTRAFEQWTRFPARTYNNWIKHEYRVSLSLYAECMLYFIYIHILYTFTVWMYDAETCVCIYGIVNCAGGPQHHEYL